MEININSNGFGNIGIGREALDTAAIGAGHEAKVGSGGGSRGAVTFTNVKATELAASEPVTDVPDSALKRDDALGRLVNAAFGFLAPPMPAFPE